MSETLSEQSTCVRRKFGCLIIDEMENRIVIDGVNGTEPGSPNLCGGDCCLRTTQNIPSGQQENVGCSHAERSAIYRAARLGIPLKNMSLIINGEPCEGCAKAIVRAGIHRVYYKDGGYSTKEGIKYLQMNCVVTRTWQEEGYSE